MKLLHKRLPAITLASAILFVACADESPLTPSTRPQFSYVGEPALILMKTYGAASSTFELSATSGLLPLGELVTMPVDAWQKVWVATDATDGEFTAIDDLSSASVDSIFVLTLVRGADGTLVEGEQTRLTGTNQVTLDIGFDLGAYVRVFKSETPDAEGGKGCSPGYWRKRRNRESWTAPYTRQTSFNSISASAFPGKTLIDVLKNGGRGLDGLGRHTVAALLNAASPEIDYALTVDQVIAEFNNAIATGNYKSTKKMFHKLNQQKCRIINTPE